jgi:hypothetical protein
VTPTGIEVAPGGGEGADPPAIVRVDDEGDEADRARKCAVDGEPGRIGTLEGELEDDPRSAPSCSGMALVEERVQQRAHALVRALQALVEGGCLAEAQPLAAELARLLDSDAGEWDVGVKTA